MANQVTDYSELQQALRQLDGGENAEITALSRTILGKEIPVITLGSGVRTVVYVGGICGTQALSTDILMQFVRDYLTSLSRRLTLFGVSMEYLRDVRRICVIPMLNPDGIEYVAHGIEGQHPMRERLLLMNATRGKDFSAWEANARGVDLRHNFEAGFFSHKEKEREQGILNGAPAGYGGEHPESEPESASLCRFLRLRRQDLVGVLALQTGAGEIGCSCADHLSAKSMAVGRSLAHLSGLRLTPLQEMEAQGELADWCIQELHRPAFTLRLDQQGAKSERESTASYERLRHALFGFPLYL